MSESGTAPESAMAGGIYVVGEFLGVERARTFTRRESGEVVNVRPRVGVQVNGEEVGIACSDDTILDALTRGWKHGDLVRVLVEVRPPFGSRGSVSYLIPGTVETRARWS